MNKVEKKINDVGESENSLLSSVSLTLKTISNSSSIRNGPNPLSCCMSSPTKRREHRQPFKTPYRVHQEPKVQYVRSTTQRSRFTAKKFTKSYRSDPLPRLKLRPYNHPWDSPLSKRDKSIQLNPYCSERARPITFDIKPPKFTRMPYGKATKFYEIAIKKKQFQDMVYIFPPNWETLTETIYPKHFKYYCTTALYITHQCTLPCDWSPVNLHHR